MRPFLALFCLVLALGSAARADVVLQPHRAIYKIEFSQASAESKLNAANGKWLVELKGGICSGYTLSYRFVTELRYENGINQVLDTRGESFEDGEGNAFQFSNVTFQNNQLMEEIKGIAQRREDDVVVTLQKPESEPVKLEEPVLFPSQHYIEVINNAKAGERFSENIVYEGIEGGKEAFAVSALISSERSVEAVDGKPYEILDKEKLRRWPVSLSYFKVAEKTESLPEWENRFLLYENGVSRDFTLDYGQFALTAKLETLEYLEKEDC